MWAWRWAWNAYAYQRWTAALLPGAGVLAVVGAAAAGVFATGLAAGVRREPLALRGRAVAVAGLAVMVALAWPLPRRGGHAHASVTLERVGGGAVVMVRVDPPDAADGARWFQVVAWQDGGRVLADLHRVQPGRWRTDRAVPVAGRWKTLVRLHRGAEMLAVPVALPADPQIGAAAISPTDRQPDFVPEQRFLMREAKPGSPWFARGIEALVVVFAAGWMAGFALVSRRGQRAGQESVVPGRPVPAFVRSR